MDSRVTMKGQESKSLEKNENLEKECIHIVLKTRNLCGGSVFLKEMGTKKHPTFDSPATNSNELPT